MRGGRDIKRTLVTAGWILAELNLIAYRPTNDQVGYITNPSTELVSTLELRNSLAPRNNRVVSFEADRRRCE